MKIRLSLVLFVLLLFAAVWGVSVITGLAAAETPRHEEIAKAVIARERASLEAWQRKDKAFFADFMSDDATFFAAMNPYRESDPKRNFLPKFEQMTEMFKFLDLQMFNPHVQVYGDTAILTYNSAAMMNMGGQTLNYTGKMTSIYIKHGATWRLVHAHESMNPAAR